MAERSQASMLALGGLLHDIGTFRERAGLPSPGEGGEYSHDAHSHAFLASRASAFTKADRLAAIALAHHDPQLPDEKVVAIADRLASAERATMAPDEAITPGRSERPLLSLLGRVYGHTASGGHIPLAPLTFDRTSLFPTGTNPSPDAYRDLWQRFEAEAAKIARPDDVETWLFLLQKYTWCMPASARADEVPDVSLFDHSRATAALSVCIGTAYLQDEATLERLLTGPSDSSATPIALLVRLDVRGIQKFLYSLTARGAARSLRGRSYYVGLLCDAVTRRVLTELDLPVTQVLYAGGGHSYLLLPPTDAARLAELRKELERAIFLLHGGELTVSIGWAELTDADMRGDALSAKWSEASRACNEDRSRPMATQDPAWLAANVFAPTEQGGLAGRCAVCQAELPGPAADEDARCGLCASFEELGRKLRRARKLAVRAVPSEAEPDRARSWFDALRSLGMEATLDGTGDTIFDLTGTDFLPEKPEAVTSYGFRPTTQVFPYDEAGELLEFGEIAKRSKGVKRLAALRMDVDNLGLLFQEGLGKNMATLSHVAALSSQLRWFYEGYLDRICDEWPDVVYGLYSGGDDLFFVGAWDVVPELAKKISDEFREYCCGNPKLTVSAGISLFPDKYPLYQAAEDSAEALDASKSTPDGQKNAITFLKHTVGWDRWPEVLGAKEQLEKLARPNGPRAILQRLRSLKAMADWDRTHRKVPTQRWRWLAAYLFARMAEQYKKDRDAIEQVSKALRDETALERLALAARWLQLEQRERVEVRK